jgi:hypothetical protein
MDSVERKPGNGPATIPQLRFISPAVAETLCIALHDGIDRSVAPGRLRRAAGHICRDAHDRGHSIERMLIDVKLDWSVLLDSLHFPRGTERIDVTSRFIALCIDEYFARGKTEDGDCRGVSLVGNTVERRLDMRGKVGQSESEADRYRQV